MFSGVLVSHGGTWLWSARDSGLEMEEIEREVIGEIMREEKD